MPNGNMLAPRPTVAYERTDQRQPTDRLCIATRPPPCLFPVDPATAAYRYRRTHNGAIYNVGPPVGRSDGRIMPDYRSGGRSSPDRRPTANIATRTIELLRLLRNRIEMRPTRLALGLRGASDTGARRRQRPPSIDVRTLQRPLTSGSVDGVSSRERSEYFRDSRRSSR